MSVATFGFNKQGRYTPSGTSAIYMSGVFNMERKIEVIQFASLLACVGIITLQVLITRINRHEWSCYFPLHKLDTGETTIFMIYASEMPNATHRMNATVGKCPLDSYLRFYNKSTPNTDTKISIMDKPSTNIFNRHMGHERLPPRIIAPVPTLEDGMKWPPGGH